MKPIRQGDVVLVPMQSDEIFGQKLHHLTLASGEVTGHRHRISSGQAELFQDDESLYLRVLSETATLSHEEHAPTAVPQGEWQVLIQREYNSQEYDRDGWRYVED